MSKFLVPILALIVLVPATIHGQTLSPFVEAGALAESSSGGTVDGLGAHVELGIFVSPTWWIGVRADAIKRRYNDARWSAHSLIVGTTRPTAYERIAVEMSGGFGALRSKEWGPIDHEKAVTFAVGPVVTISRHIAIVPQLRGFITFPDHDAPGALATFAVGMRWRR